MKCPASPSPMPTLSALTACQIQWKKCDCVCDAKNIRTFRPLVVSCSVLHLSALVSSPFFLSQCHISALSYELFMSVTGSPPQ